MESNPKHPCAMCGAKFPHECGVQIVAHYTCQICGAAAYLTPEGVYRHANDPFEDASGFCDKYGYPIPVVRWQPDGNSDLVDYPKIPSRWEKL